MMPYTAADRALTVPEDRAVPAALTPLATDAAAATADPPESFFLPRSGHPHDPMRKAQARVPSRFPGLRPFFRIAAAFLFLQPLLHGLQPFFSIRSSDIVYPLQLLGIVLHPPDI